MRRKDSPSTVRLLAMPEIVTLPREMDINNAASVCHELTHALGEPASILIADMSLTEFCDSSGIRHLVIADKAARMRGAELRLVVHSPAVLQVMQTLGVDKVLKIYDSKMAALAPTLVPATPPLLSLRWFRRGRHAKRPQNDRPVFTG